MDFLTSVYQSYVDRLRVYARAAVGRLAGLRATEVDGRYRAALLLEHGRLVTRGELTGLKMALVEAGILTTEQIQRNVSIAFEDLCEELKKAWPEVVIAADGKPTLTDLESRAVAEHWLP